MSPENTTILKDLHSKLLSLQRLHDYDSPEYNKIGRQIRDLEALINPKQKFLFGRIFSVKKTVPHR